MSVAAETPISHRGLINYPFYYTPLQIFCIHHIMHVFGLWEIRTQKTATCRGRKTDIPTEVVPVLTATPRCTPTESKMKIFENEYFFRPPNITSSHVPQKELDGLRFLFIRFC
ncbi:hypothetical protein ILYODFUR_019756 [Ilyodon furcidens]|uniref:Uncharacterized protein n=1 Tax=Ilyodon furcidens TaxID=33524 RepID=A0ABV0UUZ3_9TELE